MSGAVLQLLNYFDRKCDGHGTFTRLGNGRTILCVSAHQITLEGTYAWIDHARGRLGGGE